MAIYDDVPVRLGVPVPAWTLPVNVLIRITPAFPSFSGPMVESYCFCILSISNDV